MMMMIEDFKEGMKNTGEHRKQLEALNEETQKALKEL